MTQSLTQEQLLEVKASYDAVMRYSSIIVAGYTPPKTEDEKAENNSALIFEHLHALIAMAEKAIRYEAVLQSVENWWLEKGMKESPFGAPACMFNVRQALKGEPI